MKKLFFVLLLTTLASCESIQYDGETRLVFKTRVLNAGGAPLPNSHVDLMVSSGYDSDIISTGKTDANGLLTLVFPAPETNYTMSLIVHHDEDSYMQREITNLYKTDFENYTLNFQDVYLLKGDETAPLNLTLNQVSTNTYLKRISISGIYHLDSEYYNDPLEDYYPIPTVFLVKKNQAFQLKYKVVNTMTGVETEHTVDLQIANDPLNYTLNY